MLVIKKWCFTLLFLLSILSPCAFAAQDLPVVQARFNLFNGSSGTINSFFSPYNGASDKLVLLMKNSANQNLGSQSDWLYAGMIAPVSVNGLARVGNGQCVDFVKNVTNNFNSSTGWIQGNHVSSYWDPNALVGKVIATFTGGKYDNGHVAIIISAWKRAGSNTVTDVWVVDANYVPNQGLTVARHNINTYGSSYVSNLQNYYIVRVN